MDNATLGITIQNFYAQPGMMTDTGNFSYLLEGLPRQMQQLCEMIQGLLVHIFWAERYGLHLSEERQGEVQLRTLPQKLQRILELDDQPLIQRRPLEKKLVGNCRDHSVFLAALLQHQGVAARARCGFGTYFVPGKFIDHWVCEYWHAQKERWIMVDAQLDPFQQEKLKIDFDPLDVPHDRFITGGKAWLMCREDREDAEKFGIMDMHGLWFILGDLIRDFLALNKIEILPWDPWGLISGPDIPETDLELLDKIARLTTGEDATFLDLRTFYDSEPRLQIPAGWNPSRVPLPARSS